MKAAIFAAALLLAGCAAIHLHVDGWQDIPPTVHRIPDGKIYATCAPMVPLWQHIVLFPVLPIACTWFDWEKRTCDVYVGETSTQGTLEHELEHCQGMYHPGDLWPSDWQAWNTPQQKFMRDCEQAKRTWGMDEKCIFVAQE